MQARNPALAVAANVSGKQVLVLIFKIICLWIDSISFKNESVVKMSDSVDH